MGFELLNTEDDLSCHFYTVHFYRVMRDAISAVYVVWPIVVSVCLSVCLLRVGVPLKRLNIGSRKQRHKIAHDSSFLMPKVAKLKRRRQMQVR